MLVFYIELLTCFKYGYKLIQYDCVVITTRNKDETQKDADKLIDGGEETGCGCAAFDQLYFIIRHIFRQA